MNKPTVVITHHAVSNKSHTVEDVDVWHKARWNGFTTRFFTNKAGEFYHVGYHYVIDWDGTVTQTRFDTEEGAHTIGMNNKSIGVCFMGNFDEYYPSIEQVNAWNELYRRLQLSYPNIPTQPHRAYANKSCHGSLLTDDWFFTQYRRLTLIQELQRIVAKLTNLLTNKRMSKYENKITK